uniref:ABC transmembrane type-1 domain-containing protein n=1 Tax=Arcella intermedia TaxID=1963864 RepID=A0A6B2KWS5_9EUKA
MVYLGYKRPLELHDIWKPPPNETAELNAALFEAEWEKELKKPNPSIGWAYFRAFGYLLILPTTLFSVHLVCVIAGPGILMRDFLVFLETKDSDPTVGWILAFAVFITQLIAATTIQNSFQTSVEMGIRVKQATMYTIYKKIMTLPSVTSTGEIINLTTNDSNRFFLFCRNSQLGWSAVVQMLVVGALLIVELSWSGLIGLLTLLLLLPLQVYISRKIATVRRSTVKVTDERVRTMSDVLSAVQLIKFFAWEDSFAKKVKSIRENELTWLKRGKLLKSVNDSTSLVGVAVTTYITLVSYSLMGNELAASKVFTAITLLNMMRVSLVRVPLFAKTFAELFITFERVKSLLIRNNMIDERILRPKPDNSPAVVSVRKSSFIVGEPRSDKKSNGEKNENPLVRDHFTLEDINFRFESGTLIAIVGSVGSGKSSLLNAIMGQMKKTSGQIEIEGTLALASQEPWLINASLKENILFGESFHHKKYNLVLSNCELLEDLKQLPAGDMTEIGERGINLSGGQKQRVSLARAIYANRDIYLLDDPLSAVDRHVGNNLFHKCIRGLLREKLVFFVTNQLQYLDRCDKIMYLQDGKISGYGTFSELVNTHRAFRELVKKFTNLDENLDRDENKPQVDTKKNVDTKGRRETGSLTSQEARVMGTVDNKIYFEYFKSGGFFLCGLVLLLSISTGVSQVICNWFVSYWIDKQHENSVVFYYSLYAGLTLFYVFSAYMRGYLFAYTLLKSSTKIHNKVFKVIMHAPMTYFYSTPTGRILNRFSSDQDKIDEELPDLMYPAIHFTINSLCTLGIIMSVLYWFVLPALFMFLIFVWIIRYFMATSRELRRLEAITVSPIVAHLSATLKGLPVIRAYGVQTKFQEDYKKHLDLHHSLLQTVEIVARWIGIRLDTIGTIIVAVTAFLIMASRDLISPAIAGLALSYSFQMTGAFQFAVRSFAETDSKMTSAERLLNCLTETPQEAPHVIEHAKPPPSWPQNGAIAFQNVFMKYPVSEAPVLKDLSFKINPKEKIGEFFFLAS